MDAVVHAELLLAAAQQTGMQHGSLFEAALSSWHPIHRLFFQLIAFSKAANQRSRGFLVVFMSEVWGVWPDSRYGASSH